MATKRSSTNPPDYFHHLTKKQQRNWMRTTKGIEKNENLRQEHASFESTSHNKLVHIHRLTSATIIKELIEEAKDIHLYVIDTESEMMEHRVRGAIIQIQMIKTTEQSTVVITETCHLPERNSSLFKMIKQLYSTIFNSGNKIVSWGPYDKEIENFYEYELIEKGEFIHKIDLQNTFQKWHNQQEQIPTHLERESRDSTTDLDMRTDVQMKSMTSRCNCGHKSHEDPAAKWSLQDAISKTTNEFLDKTERCNKWSCGLDRKLETWKTRTFTKYYNQIEEQEKRNVMTQYAMNDCLATTKLFFIIYPQGIFEPEYETPPPTTSTAQYRYYESTDTSEDEMDILQLRHEQETHNEQQIKQIKTSKQFVITPTQINQEQTMESTIRNETNSARKKRKLNYRWRKNKRKKKNKRKQTRNSSGRSEIYLSSKIN